MEPWFAKSILATVCIVPSFIAIPFLKFRYGIDPLVFLAWYFAATAVSISGYIAISGRAAELVPPIPLVIAIVVIGLFFGALANGALFQAIGLAPNPGLPPVMYATASMIVFFLSAVLATSFPALFKPVTVDTGRVIGIVMVLVGLYLLAGGKVASLLRTGS
jgi:hypothetical protein